MLRLREEVGITGTLQKELKTQGEEDRALSKRIDEMAATLEDVASGEEQRQQMAAALEDSRNRMDKQLAGALGDIATANDRTEKATEKTASVCPSRTSGCLGVATSQSFTVPSSLPETSTSPLGE